MSTKQAIALSIQSNFLVYTAPSGKTKVEIFLKDENLWLTQEKIAQLFGIQRPAVTKHLRNIFAEKELKENAVSSILEHTANDGKIYQTKFYNLDAIISVGYRVNSRQATHFRIWATERLKEYIIKGFTMDDERLKNPQHIFGKDYFDEQLARIRDIRSSERRFYQKITDIYAQCSADYSPDEKITKQFFATVQNKLHWAVTKQTAAEIIARRVDSSKPNMGLKTWKNAPLGKVRKPDIGIAKNYLNVEELDNLNRIVSMYLDYAELQAKNGQIMYMQDWVKKLDSFLQFNEQEILKDVGKISHQVALDLVTKEFDKFSRREDQLVESDFDRLLDLEREKP